MVHVSALQVTFAAFGILMMTMLFGNFVARNWKPELELRYGWVIYAMGIPGLVLAGLYLLAEGMSVFFPAASLVFTAWALFGFVVDRVAKVQWRRPTVPQIFVPYVTLYVAWQVLYWIPMWSIGRVYWVVYTLLFSAATCLNLRAHLKR